MDIINEYLAKHKVIDRVGGYQFRRLTPQIVCADGLKMSVQASEYHYCEPRVNDADHYRAVEVGFPTELVPEFMKYAEEPEKPTETVYGWVPANIVNAVIEKHGGLKGA